MKKITKKNAFFLADDMSVVIHPNLAFCPINNRCSTWCNDAAILADKNILAIKNIISNIILNTIGSIVWVFASNSCTFCNRLSLIIPYQTALFQLLPFNAYGIPPPFKSLNDNNLSR